MDVSFVSDTILGGKSLRGVQDYHMIRLIHENGHLKRVVSNGQQGTPLGRKVRRVPLSRYLDTALFNIKKRGPFDFPSRYISERLFDSIASMLVPECDVLIASPPRWIRSIERAKAMGASVVVRDSVANQNYTIRLNRQENMLYGTDIPLEFYRNRKIHNRGLEQSDLIMACSEYSRRTHIHEGISSEKIEVINTGVDTSRFSPERDDPDGFRGIFVGALRPMKGIKYLFDAWEGFAKGGQELIVCGDIERSARPMTHEYARRINMKLTGFVDPSHYYRKASVFVYPSLTEGFEKVTLEAMASGLPVITTTNTGAAGVMKEGREGFVVPIRDSKTIKDRLGYFYDNPGESRRMGRNARKLAERFSWDAFSSRVCRIIENMQ